MDQPFLTFEAGSPQELKELLSQKGEVKTPSGFVKLLISGPQIVTQSFELASSSESKLKHHLMSEAVELLSLPVSEIALDWQILNRSKEKVEGVFLCMSKKSLQEYVDVLAKSRLIASKITSSMLAKADAFFAKHAKENSRFGLLNVSKDNRISIAVFYNRKNELFREIPYENITNAIHEVIQSLRSASAKSSVKQFDHIYFSGDKNANAQLIKEIESSFGVPVEIDTAENNKPQDSPDAVFRHNLVRTYSFALSRREQLLKIMCLAVAVGAALILLLGWIISKNNKTIKTERASYSAADYQRALERQNR